MSSPKRNFVLLAFLPVGFLSSVQAGQIQLAAFGFSKLVRIMMVRTFSFVFTATLMMAFMIPSLSASVIYQTQFDAYEGFIAGDINGQNGWTTYDPGTGAGFANISFTGPAGSSGGVVAFTSGTTSATTARNAGHAGYGTEFLTNGYTDLITKNLLYMPSGSTSTARLGLITYDTTGTRRLIGYHVQQNTGIVYILYHFGIGNFVLNTNVAIPDNQWVEFTTTWDRVTGRGTVSWGSSWGSHSVSVEGSSAGSIADRTDFHAFRNGLGGTASVAYFDNLRIETSVPEPSSLALFSVMFVCLGSFRFRRK